MFVCVEVKRPSNVGMEAPLPAYYQYFKGVKCLAQGHNKAEVVFESDALKLSHSASLESVECDELKEWKLKVSMFLFSLTTLFKIVSLISRQTNR